MPDSYEPLSLAGTAGFVAAATMIYSILATAVQAKSGSSATTRIGREDKDHLAQALLRKKLPQTLSGWREHGKEEGEQDTRWESLRSMFGRHGYTLWDRRTTRYLDKPGEDKDITHNGAAYATPIRPMSANPGGAASLYLSMILNPRCHAASAADGRSVIIRVVRIAEQGRHHLTILRFLARGPCCLLSNDHILPLLQEIQLEDVVFGVFPHVGTVVREAFEHGAESSVGDLIDMVLQMLAALEFIHEYRIAHRDAFNDKFLVEWQPDTLKSGTIAAERPRVYLHDFEAAVRFPRDCPVAERLVVGFPSEGLWEFYGRPSPPEVLSGAPYDPFKVDVWQLGSSLSNMKTTISDIDTLLVAMVEPDASKRMTAGMLCTKLKDIVHAMTPSSLAIPPIISEASEAHLAPYPPPP